MTNANYRHDDHRDRLSDFPMTLVSRVPVPSAFRNDTSGSSEEGDNAVKEQDSFHVKLYRFLE
jgi:hypothetical protein